jgi:superfamily II DNA helicase RecQ
MQIKLFNIPITDNGTAQTELNSFLAGNKVLEVEQKFFQNEKGACWTFCVRYIQNGIISNPSNNFKGKIDYKTILTDLEFGIFSKLREIRKILATSDAVPAYAVFTDEELANIAKLETLNITNIQTINGIGIKKVEKYGKQMIEMFQTKLFTK